MSDGIVSVIVPTYDVARYLPEFLASLDAQRAGLDGFELIFVDDGSPDESADLINAWLDRSLANARLVSKSNGGLSSARNAGLDVATGEWVTFWDPDDALDPRYTAQMREFLDSPEAADTHLVVGRLVWFNEATGRRKSHPLDYRFRAGDRLVELADSPHLFHLAANTGLYRRSVLAEFGLRFDSRVVPTFEDGHLTSRYLGKFARPRIAYRAGAIYLYRQRGDSTSLVQTGWQKQTKFSHQPRHGWLDLLRQTAVDRGASPRWAQNVVLYELLWYFRAERRVPSRTGWVPPALAAEFHATLAEVLAHIEPQAIETFGHPPGRVDADLVAALLLGVKGIRRAPAVVAVGTDADRGLVRLSYHHGEHIPAEHIAVDGVGVRPLLAKTRRIDLVGRTLAHERIVWVRAGDAVTVTLDGVAAPVRRAGAGAGVEVGKAEGSSGGRRAALAGLGARASGGLGTLRWRPRGDVTAFARRQARNAQTAQLARLPRARQTFGDAWLLMDRDTHAQDNAEHLYRYLRAEQPDVNAYFVLARDSPDWPRLAAEGFRLIEHGSRRHTVALLNARHLVSSQADHYVVSPLGRNLFARPRWHYTFLQHGVIKDDLSAWLNPKPMSAMLTTTRDERDSIIGDGTAYRFTAREIALTGLPRHDRLLRLAQEAASEGATGQRRAAVVVMPTWRLGLLGDRISAGNDRELRADFWETGYAKAWREVLESDRLRDAAAARGGRVVFVPHPNMAGYVANHPLPAHVDVRRFADIDVQRLLVEAAVLVTDYSSLGFEAAFVDRPVVYYQFDQDEFATGSHVYTPGTWSYEDAGFGPVTTSADIAVDEMVRALDGGGEPEALYRDRAAATFIFRDGQCCRRAYEAIRALETPTPRERVYAELDPGAG